MTSPGARAAWLDLDSEQMLSATAALPRHISSVLEGHRPIPIPDGPFSSVVVLGMGGSGVAGTVLQAMALQRSPVPVVVSAGYECPGFVGKDTLVFAVSFSGATEETLAAASTAIRAGAPTVALTGGGALSELVSQSGGAVLQIPPGIPQPRAGIGSMVASLLLASEQAGVLPGARKELENAVTQLEKRIPTLVEGGVAADVAARIGRTIPLVHGASGLGAVAARRWKTQVNENAKAPSFYGEQPEVCHNEVCGFGQGGDITRQLVTLVDLHIEGERPSITARFELVAELVSEAVGEVVSVRGEGEGELAGFFDLVAIGDFVSLHLAANEGVDPGPVPVLSEIKRRLAAQREG